MTKLELNEKLAELYGIKPHFQTIVGFDVNEGNMYAYLPLIDDSARMFDLAVEHKVQILNTKLWFQAKVELPTIVLSQEWILHQEHFKNHETPQAAARFAIAMALVKLAESK